jgi:hypothetical protein
MQTGTSLSLAGLTLASCFVLSACGRSEPPEPPHAKDTVFGELESTKDRARAVEDVTMQQKQSLDEAIDAQSSGAAAPAP